MTDPMDILSIAGFSFAFLSTLILIGDVIRLLLRRILRMAPRTESIMEILNLDIAMATAFIPLFTLLSTWTGRWLNQYSVYSLLVLAGIIRIYDLRGKRLLGLPSLKGPIKRRSMLQHLRSFDTVLGLVIFLALVLRLCLTVGLYVSPGDDAKMHAVYASMVVENHGYPSVWERYVPKLYLGHPVCYMMGFHSICAFSHFVTAMPVERCVLLVTNIYNGLIALSIFCMAKIVFKNKYAGLFAAIVVGFISQQPLIFFGWGGNAELAANYLLFTSLGLYYEMLSKNRNFIVYLIIGSLLMAGMFYIHYLSVCYALCCIAPYFLYKIFAQRRLRTLLSTLTFFGLPLIISSPMLVTPVVVNGTTEKIRVLEELAYWWWRNKQALGWAAPQFGLALTLFSFFGMLLLLLQIKKRTSEGIYLLGWLLLLFAVYENGPYGLYFVSLPMWYNLLPDRFFLTMYAPLSCLTGFGLNGLFKTEWRLKEGLTRPLQSNALRMAGATLVLLVLSMQAGDNIAYAYQLRGLSAVTKEDYEAFVWIKENIPANATFYVTDADAGQWIPSIAQRAVYPPFTHQSEKFYTEEFLFEKGFSAGLMYEDPDNSSLISLLSKYGVDYVYIGQKGIFDRARFDPLLLSSSVHYRLIYHPNETEVYIFQVVY